MLKLDDLKNVDTASRYIGTEVGRVTRKGNAICRATLVLPFPYEMAMSSITLRQMYYNLNKKRECVLDRCFAVMPDFESVLKEHNEELYALDSKTSLKDMNILFTELSSPLTYTTFLHMLLLANIPLLASKRGETYPIIIMGGDSALYPKPMSKMVDIFILGDMTRISEQIVDKYILCKKENKTKSEFLATLTKIEGVYIPTINKDDEKITVTYGKRLNDQLMAPHQLSPLVSSPMDSVMIELTLGCNRGCNMCQHKFIYSGVEKKDIPHALSDIKKGIEATGNRNINIITNCYGDYDGLEELVSKIKELEKPNVERISFMEVKLTEDNLWLLPYLKEQYKLTGEVPTIIVGSSSKELRDILGISMEEEKILSISRKVFRAGFNKIRLKYILGVPKETYEDLNNIFSVASKIIKIYTEEYSQLPDKYIVELDMCSFSPLPHTVLEFAPANNHAKLEMKAKYLNERNTNEYIKLSFDNFLQGELATILARGDARMCDAICKAVELGANFDFLENSFNYDIWRMALGEANIDTKAMLEEISVHSVLPWDNIVAAVSKEELAEKYTSIMRGNKDENSSDK